MKKIFAISILTLISFSLVTNSFAQGGKKKLSTKDKEVILEIFNTLNTSDYYLEFAEPKPAVVYGGRKVEWTDLQLLKDNHPTLPALWHAYKYLPEIGLTYLIRIGAKSKLKLTQAEIFGKTGAARLEAILKKYTGG